MRKLLFFTSICIVVAISVVWWLHDNTEQRPSMFLCVHEHAILVEIAETPQARARGLSGREALKQNTGMLFIFPEHGTHGMWMKDMHYSLDILWLNENMQVVHIEEHISPETFPHIFSNNATAAARYVLEVNAGTVHELTITIGDTIHPCNY